MKFNVTLTNPPYNDRSSHGNNGVHGKRTKKGKDLARMFFEMCINKSKNQVLLVGPYIRFAKSLEQWNKKFGLNKVVDCTESFNLNYTGKIGYFVFDKNNVKILTDNIKTQVNIPKNNLSQIFVGANKSICRQDFEHLLQPQGTTKVFTTVIKTGYTSDQSLINKISDKGRGNWRVVFGYNGNGSKHAGKCEIAKPQDIVGPSCISLVVKSETEAKILKKYLELDSTIELMSKTRTNVTNSKRQWQYIPNPLEPDEI